MICTLCLKEIGEDRSVEVNGRIRHKTCSDTLEKMIKELEKIYDEDKEEDI